MHRLRFLQSLITRDQVSYLDYGDYRACELRMDRIKVDDRMSLRTSSMLTRQTMHTKEIF
ncbi:hypothetical protein OPKNFCMD_3805 [Methylobacterium crusticola]|uniref:Uncharacterized protein n=1 Tax=Methylobacterium crusticola TaxID=1697972 RepID=A0ABQ4R1N1_9HYPH|nr:hypothetical protein OPKNFCMD_3805 [Methylobacterium crusticola]